MKILITGNNRELLKNITKQLDEKWTRNRESRDSFHILYPEELKKEGNQIAEKAPDEAVIVYIVPNKNPDDEHIGKECERMISSAEYVSEGGEPIEENPYFPDRTKTVRITDKETNLPETYEYLEGLLCTVAGVRGMLTELIEEDIIMSEKEGYIHTKWPDGTIEDTPIEEYVFDILANDKGANKMLQCYAGSCYRRK